MNGLTLYEISQELVELKALRDDAEYTGDTEAVKVIDGQIQEWVKGCLATKADGVRGYLKTRQAQWAEWQEEVNRWTALAKAAREDVERFKEYVLDAMRLLDAKRIEGSRGDVLLRRVGNGGVKPLVIAQPNLVPDSHLRVTVTIPYEEWKQLDSWGNSLLVRAAPDPDRAAIRKTLEAGGHVPGCRLDERGEHLRVE
jgi:Gp157 protein